MHCFANCFILLCGPLGTFQFDWYLEKHDECYQLWLSL